jgi:hypothetical protein
MNLLFVRKYLPVSQRDAVDGFQDIEERGSSSSLGNGMREKDFAMAVKPSASFLWNRWIPWLLSLSLLFSNIHSWMKLKGSVFDAEVYCKPFK